MKNILFIDRAFNTVEDVFAATEEEFSLIFSDSQPIAFASEIRAQGGTRVDSILEQIRTRQIRRRDVTAIHGLLFIELASSERQRPAANDACSPDGGDASTQ